MAKDVKPGQALPAAVGERVRAWRKLHGVDQDRVAFSARVLGFKWGRSSVAMLEQGKRNLSAEELLALPFILNRALLDHEGADSFGQPVSLAALLPSDGPLNLSDVFAVPGQALSDWLGAAAPSATVLDDHYRQAGRRIVEDAATYITMAKTVWPGSGKTKPRPVDFVNAERDIGEPEQKIGRSLGVPAGIVGCAAYGRWGHSLRTEREARVAARADQPHRSVQALRGHVTRELIAELTPALQEAKQATAPPLRSKRKDT